MDFSTFENKQPPKGFDKMEYLAKIKNQLYESIDNFAQLKGNTDIEHVFLAMKEAQKSFLDLLIIFRANEYSMTESIKQLTLDSIINSIESNGKQFASEEEFNKHMDETRSSITEHVCGDNLKDIPRVIFSDLVPRVDRDGQPIINECGNPSLDSAQKALLVNVGFLLFSKIETLSTLMLSANVLKKTQREL